MLEYVALFGQKKGVSIQDISKSLKMNRSNVYRYLRTLVDNGWIEYDLDTYKYKIGGKSLQIAGASLQQIDLRATARPFLEDLAKESCLAVHLGILNDSSIVYIDKVESNSPIQMRSKVGMTAPAYCTAMGKAMLSSFEFDELKDLLKGNLPKRTKNTITSMNELYDELIKIKQIGYSVDLEENEEGIGCIAAAIFGYDDELVGAVSVSTLIQNLLPNISFYSKKVMFCAKRISESMGYRYRY